ncbi:peptidyl-prolyl cis-trans isomerase FKBP18, chloroplastic-like [Dioscorea cayenensis subsp. rotundata]|uniref:peptidylprolyl isomerase n=1 Tax=Dioscorea cayennensis subsp. rotundata TaxID=55577 RepID=A0AB40D3M2_DIOCR|nr:peptidyl-prolyl cis-trans isomerase FKBP18, chloroplastic-like [Dioscorea cayenensis subsp. rotundata]
MVWLATGPPKVQSPIGWPPTTGHRSSDRPPATSHQSTGGLPYEFTVGSPSGKERKREFVDNANGLYSAQAAPKPPKALYTITEGMKVGGKRTVIVPPDLGYGQNGLNEIPPGAPFELNVELLQVMSPATAK